MIKAKKNPLFFLLLDETYVTITTEHLDSDEQRSFTNSRSMTESTSFQNVERTSFQNVERTSTTVAKTGKKQQTFDPVGQQIGKYSLVYVGKYVYLFSYKHPRKIINFHA